MFAPAMRNVLDRECSVETFADAIDVLACNRQEWRTLENPQRVDALVSVVAITNGPNGSSVRYNNLAGQRIELEVPVFPRRRPPRDTNRAGEAYASTLVATLLAEGWDRGRLTPELVGHATRRASAAAALVLDLKHFGFPTVSEVDSALASGCVE